MAILKYKCSTCNALAEETNHTVIGDIVMSVYACGHTNTRKASHSNKLPVVSADGCLPYDFQEDAYDFLVNKANLRGLARLEMRMGKTPLSCMIIKRHPEYWPVLYVCRGGLTSDVFAEIIRWTGMIPQVLETGRDLPFPQFKIFICSFDLLPKMLPKFKSQGIDIKLVIGDEVQHMKNERAARTKALAEAVANPDIKCIALSGTPIKNHAAEYFTILNMLHPEIFPTKTEFIKEYVDIHFDGSKHRLGGIRKTRLNEFNRKTSSFVISMDRDTYMPYMSKPRRNLIVCDMDKEVNDAYAQNNELFIEEYERTQSIAPGSSALKYLTLMRHLVGIAKIKPVVEKASDFIYDTERRITLFVHHRDVGQRIFDSLANVCKATGFAPPLRIVSEMDADQRRAVLRQFEKDDANRILIAATKTANEGIKIDFCNDAWVCEREWTPFDEFQAEARFIGPLNKNKFVDIGYFCILNTIDEMMAKLNSIKDEVVTQTLTGKIDPNQKWSEQNMMKALADQILKQGRVRTWSFS